MLLLEAHRLTLPETSRFSLLNAHALPLCGSVWVLALECSYIAALRKRVGSRSRMLIYAHCGSVWVAALECSCITDCGSVWIPAIECSCITLYGSVWVFTTQHACMHNYHQIYVLVVAIGPSGPYTQHFPIFWVLSDSIAAIGLKNVQYWSFSNG